MTVIYCGPTINNGELQQYSVFRGELPEHVKKYLENEAVNHLIVDVNRLASVKKNIMQRGTLDNQMYLKALEYAKGGKN